MKFLLPYRTNGHLLKFCLLLFVMGSLIMSFSSATDGQEFLQVLLWLLLVALLQRVITLPFG